MENKSQMLFSKKDLAKIIIPLVIQGILAIAISMVDSIMVSSEGEAAFAGVSLVGSLDTLIVTLFSSLTSGGAVVLAQAMGQKDRDRACEGAKQLTYSTAIISLVISIGILAFRIPLLNALFGDSEQSVMANAIAYFSILALSYPFLAVENSIFAIFRAQGDSMISLKVSLLKNLLNVGGNALLIYWARMGASGAALATLISRVIGVFIAVWIARDSRRYIYLKNLFRFRPDFSIIRAILRIGIPNGIENSMFQFGRLMTSSLVSSLPTAAIAANSAALSLAGLQYSVNGAVQNTMVTVVGQCVGAREKKQARHYACSLTGVGYGLIFGAASLLCLLSTPLLGLYNLSDEAFSLARIALFYHSAVSVLIYPLSFCLPASFRAASDVRFTMLVSIFSMWVFRVALAYFLAKNSISFFGLLTLPGLNLGLMGVWYAMTADWGCRAALFLWRFLSGKWLTKYRE